MATTTVDSIIARAAILLNDLTNVRWTVPELVGWISAGQRDVLVVKPEAYVINAPVLLTPSATRQSLPAGAITLLDVVRNMGADGLTPGQGIAVSSRDALNAQAPGWHSTANTAGLVEHFTFDPRNTKEFYVYPMAPATPWYVDVVYSAIPADCVSGGVITIDDIYANALLDYTMSRCLSKDATNAQNIAAAGAYYNQFLTGLIGKSRIDAAWNPNNLGTSPANPDIPTRAVQGAS